MKKKSLFIVIFCSFLILGVIGYTKMGNDKKIEPIIPQASSHLPITIDGNEALDAYCAGNETDGLTESTAHVIEDINFYRPAVIGPGMNSLGSVVEISNTDRHLIFRNCSVQMSGHWSTDAGMEFHSVQNIRIEESTVYNNTFYGIVFYNSTGNVVENCIFYDNPLVDIILIDESDGNRIEDNNFIGENIGQGIRVVNSSNCDLVSNEFHFKDWGISILTESNSLVIAGNLLLFSRGNIRASDSKNLTIYENSAYDGQTALSLTRCNNSKIYRNFFGTLSNLGIHLSNTSHSSVFGNLIDDCTFGLDISEFSENNTMYMNTFSACSTSSASDTGSDNKWNSTTWGNYWDDYETQYPAAISTNDIWWDTPYEIIGPGIFDYLPMKAPGAPQINSPGDLMFTQGGSDTPIYWVINDTTILTPYNKYTVSVNHTPVDWGYWVNGDSIFIDTSNLTVGEHDFRLSIGDGTVAGHVSDSITITITELGVPSITTESQTITIDNVLIEWGSVPDADYFNVYVDGALYDSSTQTEMLVNFTTDGIYEITVTAVNNAFETVQSDEIVVTAEFELELDPEPQIPGYSHLLSISIIGMLSTIVLVKKQLKKK